MVSKNFRDILPRAVGLAYLLYIGVTILSDRLGRFGFGSPAEVYAVLSADEATFRLGLTALLFSFLLFSLVAWGLFAVFRPVNPDLACLLLVLNAVGTAVSAASAVFLSAALLLDPDAALVAIGLYKRGFMAAQLFFSAWLFPLASLALGSGLLPRALGYLLIGDGVGVLVWFLQSFLWPERQAIIYPGLAVSFAAEVSLGAWLAFRGASPRLNRSRRGLRP